MKSTETSTGTDKLQTKPQTTPDVSDPEFDPSVAERFADHMVGVLNDAAVALMTSIGHQVGLFHVMAQLAPSTSQEVADAAGLQERYVREWLGAVTTGRIVRHDPKTSTYWLPAEHAACLTRSRGRTISPTSCSS
ncbi:MAG: hypothetical protein ACR2J5_12585 [Geodermatophilaceae bacterium]